MKKAGLFAFLALFVFFTSSAPFAKSYPTEGGIIFRDIAKAAGIHFVHDNAATAEKYLIETMGSGCGWIDYDADGLLDLYLVNGAATRLYKPKKPLRGALYRNNGDGTFTDVTEKAGVGAEGLFGMGVAVGDYDNDGYPDLMVLGYDRSILYHNNRNGTFSDVTERAGVANKGKWASSAAWFDYDRDGKLDLEIANYVAWSPDNNIWCGDEKPGYRGYCHPNKFRGQKPTLYHNKGDGAFTDVTETSGIGAHASSGLGIVTFDFDNDGWQDVFIANDANPNFLFRNDHDGRFSEMALQNNGRGAFDNLSDKLGPDLQLPRVSRGAAMADVDNDGDIDVLVSNNGQEPQLLLNEGGAGNHWLEVALIGVRSNRDGVGARVKVVSGDLVSHDERKGGRSYQSAHDSRLSFGLGARSKIELIEVRWPSGAVDTLKNIEADRVISVKESVGLIRQSYPRWSIDRKRLQSRTNEDDRYGKTETTENPACGGDARWGCASVSLANR